MKNIKYLILVFIAGVIFSSCQDYLDPIAQNQVTEELLFSDPTNVEGFLMQAYRGLPGTYNYMSDAATDNAVTNNYSLNYLIIANGAWSSEFNPVSGWNGSYSSIASVNKFLSVCDKVEWHFNRDSSDASNKRYSDAMRNRLKGEAHGLRAYFYLQLLQEHAGVIGGVSYGVPIVKDVVTFEDDYHIPRSTVAECVNFIVEDCDSALHYLPWNFVEYKEKDNADYVFLNHVYGDHYVDRVNGEIAATIKALAQLLGASPAFNLSNDTKLWENAAASAAQIIDSLGGINELPDLKKNFYDKVTTKHMDNTIWARSPGNRNDYEKNLYPPSYFGAGLINPSQNLVDAFPASDGYPIASSAVFDPANPYKNRDDRFAKYIAVNGSKVNGQDTVFTYVGADKDGINSLASSTRTGYYVQKFIDPSISVRPGQTTNQSRATVIFRYGEVFLAFAEAANEAWGPTDNRLGFSAQEALGAIRERAGISSSDPYMLTVVGGDQSAFRTLVRNERRIETCFEGKRFWDIRRWLDTDAMQETAKGVSITKQTDGSFTYEYINVEERNYADYMIYPPIPYTEVIRMGLTQNDNWK